MNDYDSLSYEALKITIEKIRAINELEPIRATKLIMISYPDESVAEFEARCSLAKKLAKGLVTVCAAQSVDGKLHASCRPATATHGSGSAADASRSGGR